MESFEEHFEESKEEERTSLIKTTNSIESGCLDIVCSPSIHKDKDIESLIKAYIDQEAQICPKAST